MGFAQSLCCRVGVHEFTNPPPSRANPVLKCPLECLLPPTFPPEGPCPHSCPCMSVLPGETQPRLSSARALCGESDTNTCHPRKCLCHPPFCVRGHREPVDQGAALFFVAQARRSRMLRWADKMWHVLGRPLTACLNGRLRGLRAGRAGCLGGC